jgi:hypothetical protein
VAVAPHVELAVVELPHAPGHQAVPAQGLESRLLDSNNVGPSCRSIASTFIFSSSHVRHEHNVMGART